MTTLTVVQARMGSTRLPGKALADIGGKTVLERVIDRLELATEDIGRIVVATTVRGNDNPIADLCYDIGVDCYRSSERDVLNRFYRSALDYQACEQNDVIVRITADCPLLCPELLAATIRLLRATEADYAGVAGAPAGFGQEAFTFSALERAWALARMPDDREHVVTFIESQPDEFRLAYVEADEALRSCSHWRLTLDEQEDLDLMRALYAITDGRLFEMTSAQILGVVQSNVALVELAERVA